MLLLFVLIFVCGIFINFFNLFKFEIKFNKSPLFIKNEKHAVKIRFCSSIFYRYIPLSHDLIH